MPTGSNNPPAPGNRSTFRPPWVRDTPPAVPMPTAPWTLNRRSQDSPNTSSNVQTPQAQLRKVSKITLTPSENGTPKEVSSKLQSREIKVPVITERAKPVMPMSKPKPPVVESQPKPVEEVRARPKPVEEVKASPEPRRSRTPRDEPKPEPRRSQTPRDEPKPKAVEEVKVTRRSREESKPRAVEEAKVVARETIEKAIPIQKPIVMQEPAKTPSTAPVPPPPMPPPAMPPPPPPPPPNIPSDFKAKPLSNNQAQKLHSLRSRPRRRPDWTDMMKEVESGRKLNHVVCNDRSSPILSTSVLSKAKGQFVYETEKANVHNILLKQIQFGVPLKRVKCNDRSKPILDGLRKFRRQMTIEEQIQKSQSQANLSEPPPEEDEEIDEMDDIDKIRDDLQSTKQLLALELRNKEAQDRENKRLLARILNLEAEMEREKSRTGTEPVANSDSTTDDGLIKSLKDEATLARRTTEVLENKYQKTAEELDLAKSNLEETKKQNAMLERKLQQALQGTKTPDRRPSEAAGLTAPAAHGAEPESPVESEEESESDSEEDEETKAERATRRLQRELKLLSNKLKNFKDKEQVAKKERKALKEALSKQQEALKAERKKYKLLQREVDKMASLMKEGSDEEDEEEDADPLPTDSESSDSEESESESESESDSEDEDATDDQKKDMLSNRAKRHEGILNALKKGNYLLKANVDRLKDDLNKQKEMSLTLQEDLNSVLSELG